MKKIIIVLIFQVLIAGILSAQPDSIAINLNDTIQQELYEALSKLVDTVCENPDVKPEFPNGPDALKRYIAKTVIYPRSAAMHKEQGRVFVKFIVETDGTVGQVEIARGISPALDAEAIRVIKSLPVWKPGIKDGKPVRVSYAVPINFRLQ